MTRLLIIADDFTGSLDTGVQFAKRGINTLVTVLRDQAVDLTADCQALVVNTESRHVPRKKHTAKSARSRKALGGRFYPHLQEDGFHLAWQHRQRAGGRAGRPG